MRTGFLAAAAVAAVAVLPASAGAAVITPEVVTPQVVTPDVVTPDAAPSAAQEPVTPAPVPTPSTPQAIPTDAPTRVTGEPTEEHHGGKTDHPTPGDSGHGYGYGYETNDIINAFHLRQFFNAFDDMGLNWDDYLRGRGGIFDFEDPVTQDQ